VQIVAENQKSGIIASIQKIILNECSMVQPKANDFDRTALQAVQASLQTHHKSSLNQEAAKPFLSSTARLILLGIGHNRLHSAMNPLVTLRPAQQFPDTSNVIEFNNKKRAQDEKEKNSKKHQIEPRKDQPAKCDRCNRLGHTKAACIQPRRPNEGPSL
jgi:hypothetical protein